MAIMNGDLFQESEYNKWKKHMATLTTYAGKDVSHLRVINENLLGDTLWIRRADGSDLRTTNEKIFSAFADVGLTPEMLEKRIPKTGWEYLGVYMGVELGLDPGGQFALGPCPDQPEVIEVDVDTSCQHGFVVRDVQGPNRFLCKECEERFPSYPEKEKFTSWMNTQIDKDEAYQAAFIGKDSQEDYMWAKGTVMTDTKIYQWPVMGEIVQSVEFMGDDYERL